MESSNSDCLNLLDLPNEMLLLIMKQLNMVDVLYSLVNVTQRLDQLVLNSIFTRTLDMTCLKTEFFPNRAYSIDDHVLERVCQDVLPRINHQVNELIIDQHSINRVLHASDYRQLVSLSLIDIDETFFFESNDILLHLLNKQITSLVIDMNDKSTDDNSIEYFSLIFSFLLEFCRRLTKLHFCPYHYRTEIRAVQFSPKNCQSANLVELKVSIDSFDECLYLFDGHFPSLSRLILSVKEIKHTSQPERNTEKIFKLKHFSLSSNPRTFSYDDLVLPLLQRMINLEELTLSLSIIRIDSNYIDGVQLHDDILHYMPRLNKFTFSIETAIVKNKSDLILSSNEEIQRSFLERGFGPVGSHVDIFSKENGDQGHAYSLSHKFYSRSKIYSLPYQFTYFSFLSTSFQKGTFEKVQTLMMADIRSFEHEFFQIIAQSFPLLRGLNIFNNEPQKSKQQTRTLITFPKLIHLDINSAHVDYAEQFLLDQDIHLPCLLQLRIRYESLVSATNHFTDDATRLTCSKLKHLCIDEPFVPPEHFHRYFSSLEMLFFKSFS